MGRRLIALGSLLVAVALLAARLPLPALVAIGVMYYNLNLKGKGMTR